MTCGPVPAIGDPWCMSLTRCFWRFVRKKRIIVFCFFSPLKTAVRPVKTSLQTWHILSHCCSKTLLTLHRMNQHDFEQNIFWGFSLSTVVPGNPLHVTSSHLPTLKTTTHWAPQMVLVVYSQTITLNSLVNGFMVSGMMACKVKLQDSHKNLTWL